jgi:hypothetical protein
MFHSRITLESDAVILDTERLPYADIADANVEEGVLVLRTDAGLRRMKLRRGDAMNVLEAVLDGIERAHPRAPYRSPAPPSPSQADVEQAPRHKLRRRTASAGKPDPMIGRTFSAG